MATYPRLSPANLATLSPVIDDPTDLESANKLAQVDLQTRRFIYDYLAGKFSVSTEKLLPAAIDDTTLASKVAGSTNNAGTERAIVQGTVSTPDLRDSAVATTKILDGAVTTIKVADLAITTGKLAADCVTGAKVADDTLGSEHYIANSVDNVALKADVTGVAGAVTTDHIRDGAITAAKLATNAVGTASLPKGTVAGQIFITGNDPYTPTLKSMSGDATIDLNGVVTLASKTECELIERKNNTVAAGSSTATTWQNRGAETTTVTWIENWRTSTAAFASTTVDGHIILPAGTYLIEASAPGYKVGRHVVRLSHYNVSDVLQGATYGTAQNVPAASAVQSTSHVSAKITVASSDYLVLEHYTELTEATDGLGYPTSGGVDDEVYAVVRIRKLA